MSTTAAIVALWGGSRTLGKAVKAEHELIPLLRQGLPFAALEHTLAAFALARDEVAEILDLPPRTFTRRKQTQRLAADESDRLYRLTRVMAHAERVLGTRLCATQWLHRPNRALNGETPLSLLDTDIGTAQVDDALGRLEHGIFS